MSMEPTVYILDDEAGVRESLGWSVESIQLKVVACATSHQFFEMYDPGSPACLVLDMQMPEIGGLEVLEQLRQRDIKIPAIVITGFADVDIAVKAMQFGAVDFLQKPVNVQVLLHLIQSTIQQDVADFEQRLEIAAIRSRYEELTPRERDVFTRVCQGKSNKEIATELEIAVKTSETHKGNLTRKMNANNLGDLIRMGIKIGTDKPSET